MRILKTGELLTKINEAIVHEKPFSHIRFGDGGLKLIHALINGDRKLLELIIYKEGLPRFKVHEIFELWGYYARHSDVIDTPEVYYTGNFWPRVKTLKKPISKQTNALLINWKDLYSRAEFDNDTFCNPESNYLMLIDLGAKRMNLLDIMRDRKLCVIAATPRIEKILREHGYDIDYIQIVRQYQGHYDMCFNDVMRYIGSNAREYDLWLVAAGELGRIYSGFIKDCGGRSVDIGFTAEFWSGKNLHTRLTPFLMRSPACKLELMLTKEGRKYINGI